MGEVCESGVNNVFNDIQGREPLNNGPFQHFNIKLSLL